MTQTKLLVAVLVLQGLVLLGQWTGPDRTLPPAHAAGLPNPAAQRDAAVDELRSANAKLDRLIGILESGNLQVKVVKAEEGDEADRRGGGR